MLITKSAKPLDKFCLLISSTNC